MNDAATSGARQNIFLFPLGTVLFPGGLLPLKIFEQRYVEMTKACLRDNQPFGVSLIREGREVGEPAMPYPFGCTALIEQWEMPTANMFHLLARGGERFRIIDTAVAGNGLLSGEVELLPPAVTCAPDAQCAALMKRVIEQIGEANFLPPIRLDDGTWVAYQLAAMLNFPMPLKQRMLEADAVDAIYAEIKKSIKSNT